ncbi:30S ribosomal protein S20 [candidate division WS6 bacterium RIFOXYD1_FULL_33_8]|nr:MAG: 30S ribosomal protein S20, small subunit ribosomal protein S20 [candidate division WS6 bacterium GW2011_WS6_33_547]OGC35919.1 MAG: 30S ribosomal protein S20 [candidate division WS6 bacterium RIFOXYB1_FULL_33_15]OGC36982.1 MAG: 30S ribosomal protein S20 [candidate division WS6 bacterium RIFOXYC1_FULL_33_9]OGC42901.1 MAG: 30S ribosomal protein S20 [candidate division WS6 bacterium RIFOXYD1_FULL_33_8]
MPNLKTSIKDLRQTKRRTVYNDRLRKRIKKSVKRFQDQITAGEKDGAEKSLKQTFKVLDKASKKHVINKGRASRKRSRLAIQLNKLSINNVKDTKKGA